jgi:hypothetical protein
MPKSDKIEEREAKQGEKMIEVKLRFWTNDIAEAEGKIVPKHAWSGGVVRIERNASHGIDPGAPVPFHSLLDVGTKIEKVLIDHGIVLHPGQRMQKYIASE